MIEVAEESDKAEMREAFQMVKSVTGTDEVTVKRVLDEMGGDTTRAVNRLLDLEAKEKVENVIFFLQKVDENTQVLVSGDCGSCRANNCSNERGAC